VKASLDCSTSISFEKVLCSHSSAACGIILSEVLVTS
jgi:hypothetical protein